MTSEGGAAADLSATIWPQVDRAPSGISAEAELGVLDLIVRITRDEVIRSLRALKRDAELSSDYLREHNLTVNTTLPPSDLGAAGGGGIQ